MKLGSLFSGRGGFEAGASACGIETAWTCEITDFLHYKLKRLVPNATHYRDVRFVENPAAVEIITAGFPCQDISVSNCSGKKGIRGHRSGLWSEVYRITREVKPRYLVLENSPNILNQGFEYVLSDLSSIGYDAEWTVGELRTSGTPIIACGSTLLPTPVATDGKVSYCNHRALFNYRKNGYQRRLIYECQLAGLKDSEILDLYREIMSFPLSVAKLQRSETQLCLW